MSESTTNNINSETPAAPAPSEANPASALKDLENQLKEANNKYIYLYADFENYKKRAIKDRQDAMKFGWESLAKDLLEVIDNLERSLDHMPSGTDQSLKNGIQMVLTQFKGVLEKGGVLYVPAIEKPFNPEFHEAVGQIHSDHPEGTIIQEQSKGYTMHGRLLRPARVILSMGKIKSEG